MIDTLRRTFELHGFAGIETRAVEPMDQLLRKGEIDKEVYVLRRLQAEAEGSRQRHGSALRPDRAVRALRARERRQAGVPVPPLPDPEGLAGRAAAGGPLPRVHPGRHRRGDEGRPALPLRRRGRAGHGRGALGPAAAAAAAARQQPQADRGLLPRHRRRGPGRGDHDRSTSSTSCRPSRSRRCSSSDAGLTEPRPSSASSWPRSAAATPSFVDQVRALGVEHELLDTGLAELAAVSTAARACAATASRSRPASASPAGWTTTPAPSSRSTWSASST